MRRLAIALSCLLPLPALADDFADRVPDPTGKCPTWRVDTSAMGPPRNQGKSALCYAYAASDLVSFHLGYRVSSVHLALKYNKSWMSVFSKRGHDQTMLPNYGSVPHAINAAQDHGGFCDEESVRSDLGPAESVLDRYYAIEKLKNRLNDFPLLRAPADQCEQLGRFLSDALPQLDTELFLEVFKNAQKAMLLPSLTKLACSKAAHLPHPWRAVSQDAVSYFDKPKALNKLQTELEAGRPVAVGINLPEWGGGHGVTVIGRGMGPGGTCQYLIRDQGNHKSPGSHYWVDEERVRKGLLEVTSIEKVRTRRRATLGR